MASSCWKPFQIKFYSDEVYNQHYKPFKSLIDVDQLLELSIFFLDKIFFKLIKHFLKGGYSGSIQRAQRLTSQ